MAGAPSMGIRDSISDFGDFLDSNTMTGRQAALIVAVWTGGTILFGIIAFILVFLILGY